MSQDTFPLRPSCPLIFADADRRPDLDAVEILSDRLMLRPVTLAYLDIIFAEFTPEITRYLIARSPQEISETKRFVTEATEKRRAGRDLSLVILARSTAEFLGICGIHGRKNPREPELGIWLKKSAHGHTFGREAIAALCDWAERAFIVDAFLYPVDRANIPSRKIPEAMGGAIVGEERCKTMSGGELDTVVYRIPVRAERVDQRHSHAETQRGGETVAEK